MASEEYEEYYCSECQEVRKFVDSHEPEPHSTIGEGFTNPSPYPVESPRNILWKERVPICKTCGHPLKV